METLYYLEKEGVYFHGIFGIYVDLDVAIEDAKFASDSDNDDYHTWVVKKFEFARSRDYTSDSADEVMFYIRGKNVRKM